MYRYFIAYTWSALNPAQFGNGNVVMTYTAPIRASEDIEMMQAEIARYFFAQRGIIEAEIVVMNFILLSQESTHGTH